MIQKIVEAKDPILRQKSKPVKKIDKKIKKLAKDLLDTIAVQKDPEGVGLAAIQIGKPIRIFAMLWRNGFRIIVNPEIVSISKKVKVNKKRAKTILEGCLSVPDIYGPLQRPQKLTLRFTNLEGKRLSEVFQGFSAQIVQHEIDHLNGVLFTDRLIKEKGPIYKFNKKNEDWEEISL